MKQLLPKLIREHSCHSMSRLVVYHAFVIALLRAKCPLNPVVSAPALKYQVSAIGSPRPRTISFSFILNVISLRLTVEAIQHDPDKSSKSRLAPAIILDKCIYPILELDFHVIQFAKSIYITRYQSHT